MDGERIKQLCKRAIDKGEPVEDYKFYYDVLFLMKEQENIINSLNSDLNETLDVVSGQLNVVRCKDCRHFEPDGVYTMCYRHNGLSQGADWFCADGERKLTL